MNSKFPTKGLSCFWLVIPLLLWNIIFFKQIPAQYNDDSNVDQWLLYAETAFRLIAFMSPLLLSMKFERKLQKTGLGIYIAGSLFYYGSWLPIMFAPHSSWSNSPIGILAPYGTPLIVLIGIGLIARSKWYILVASLFIALHLTHGIQAFQLW
ncbi:MAG: hypothetical protein GY810_30950 [Aureispira sp.]|nr:hypothetical protein [Aureispira sp.]